MKIISVKSHVLECDMPEELGYSQQYYAKRTAHLVEVVTDEGVTGWGECFGPGAVALANKAIVEKVIQPLILTMDPLDRDVIWHKVYNLLRDHGQKGMPLQALSGVDIALWDIAGKVAGLPLHKLIGGAHRSYVRAYGYGMMLKRESVADHVARFADEAAAIRDMGFAAVKMKTGLGAKDDVKLAEAVRRGVGDDFDFMADANHAYCTADAFYVGHALGDLGAFWFEEPVAPRGSGRLPGASRRPQSEYFGRGGGVQPLGLAAPAGEPGAGYRPAGGLRPWRGERISAGAGALPCAFHPGL